MLPIVTASAAVLTLITGDQLQLTDADARSMSVHPARGRESVGFKVEYEYSAVEHRQHLFVIPMDAKPLIASDRLDRELFDVTTLLDSNYDDAKRASLPLIVTYEGSQALSPARTALAAAATVTHHLGSVNADAIQAPKQQMANLWQTLTAGASGLSSPRGLAASGGSIKKVWLDRLIKPVLDQSVPQIGAPAAWAAGYTGAGIVVGVVDTGVDAAHPDLAGKVIAQQNFIADVGGEADNLDHVGHGTHVASIIAGTGVASGGKYRGVAPDAHLVAAKVCLVQGCPTSSIIAGMEWAVTQQGAKVINMSLGGPQSPGVDPMEEAVNQLTAQYGALFVIAAGNSGPDVATVSTPAIADAALAVAAVDKSDQLAPFSSRGPRLRDLGVKPEISAPGVNIVAARASGTNIGPPVGDFYTMLSGTSMATPHVTGAAALLKQLHPDWTAAQLKAMLMGSARMLTAPAAGVSDLGAGRVDVAAAFTASVLAEPAGLSMGIVRWPHDHDAPTTRVVTYRNIGTTNMVLALTLNAVGPDGNAPPPGMFAINPATLTVPAGGTAAATISVNTRIGADGLYSGRLIGTYGAKTVSTPLAIDREEESYDVTIDYTKLDGTAASAGEYDTTFVPLDKKPLYTREVGPNPGDPTGEATVRLPAGRYSVWSTVQALPSSGEPPPAVTPPFAAFVDEIDLRSPMRLAIDVRAASRVTLPKPTATSQSIWTHIGWDMPLHWSLAGFARAEVLNPFWPDTIYFSTRGSDPERAALTSWISRQWADSGTSGSFQDATRYAATWLDHGHLPTGPVKALPGRRIASLSSSYGPPLPAGATTVFETLGPLVARHPGDLRLFGVGIPRSVPGPLTEYVYSNEPDDVSWYSGWQAVGSSGIIADLEGGPRHYRLGHHYSTMWNAPPFGPGFLDDLPATPTRQGDLLTFPAAVYADRAGHPGNVAGNYHTVVYRDGVKRGEFDGTFVQGILSPDPSTYRIEVAATQKLYGLSNPVNVGWTFNTAHVDDNTTVQLPLMSLRFVPKLNDKGQAYRDTRFNLPLVVSQLHSGSAPEARCREDADEDSDADVNLEATSSSSDPWAPCRDNVANVTLDVSFDDGSSWQATRVRREGRQWVAEFAEPASATYVSLRASASDFRGNGVEQTVIRAYGLIDRPQSQQH